VALCGPVAAVHQANFVGSVHPQAREFFPLFALDAMHVGRFDAVQGLLPNAGYLQPLGAAAFEHEARRPFAVEKIELGKGAGYLLKASLPQGAHWRTAHSKSHDAFSLVFMKLAFRAVGHLSLLSFLICIPKKARMKHSKKPTGRNKMA